MVVGMFSFIDGIDGMVIFNGMCLFFSGRDDKKA